jgi:hypothetical protein
MENLPVASDAALVAAKSPAVPQWERRELLAEVARRQRPQDAAAPSASEAPPPEEDWFEMAGFFGEPDPDGHGEALRGARFKVMLHPGRATVGMAVPGN